MLEEIKMRKCNKCKEEKPLTNEYYYAEKTAKEGFITICKDCVKSKYEIEENFDINIWYETKSSIFKTQWNFDDIKWMYDNYLIINKQILKNKFPNKSYKTLTNIIYQWNIRKIDKNDDWTKEDIQYLINNYSNMPQNELEEYFNDRTWVAIKMKASKLNLCRSKDFMFNLSSNSHKGYIPSDEARINMGKCKRGKNNYNWKGGLTPLHIYFRSMLYEWKLNSLKEYDFKCALTNENNNDLEIHHSNENFSNIIVETLNLLNLPIRTNMIEYSDEELKLINENFLSLHYKYGLGIPLKKIIHQLYHSIFGRENNTLEQFEEFKQRYILGEFNEQLKLMEENRKIILKRYKPSNGKKYKKLIKDEVSEVKSLINKNMPDKYIANLFKVSETVIYNIRTNKTWKNAGLKEVI